MKDYEIIKMVDTTIKQQNDVINQATEHITHLENKINELNDIIKELKKDGENIETN